LSYWNARLVINNQEIGSILTDIDRSLADFLPLWHDVGRLVIAPRVTETFKNEGPADEPWIKFPNPDGEPLQSAMRPRRSVGYRA
jgi:hypothetical protein